MYLYQIFSSSSVITYRLRKYTPLKINHDDNNSII